MMAAEEANTLLTLMVALELILRAAVEAKIELEFQVVAAA